MNIRRLFFAITLMGVALASNADAYQDRVKEDFYKKYQIFEKSGAFNIFKRTLPQEELEAMQFLYAYMTLGDITDYSSEFYLRNVRHALKMRKLTRWGHKMPDDIFRHFVLPVRVNNENLDLSRIEFAKELIPRVKNLSAYEAVLEVNHWCHEKVNYQPSDGRTSAPMATVKSAYGRCGEESTFLVAALRSVGIPARQVYTPRWAHTDDNHAWVEAWVEGKWYFLGACEPEPVLNLGWFNAPASRGMLMHTKVFGYYEGPEEVMSQTANYTEINVISNYAENTQMEVTVVDATGAAVEGANVEFRLYNYAEFYPVSRKKSDKQGKVTLSAGLGDMVVIAYKENLFGMEKVSFANQSEVKVMLNHKVGEKLSMQLELTPPKEKANLPEVSAQQRAENDRRFNYEDSLRNAYVATFYNEASATDWVQTNMIKAPNAVQYLVKSRGNHSTIKQFLIEAKQNGNEKRASELLSTLTDKDLRDVPLSVLNDHLTNTSAVASVERVLAPRVELEMLSDYRSFFKKRVPADLQVSFKENPENLVTWCRKNVALHPEHSTVNTVMRPAGVWRSKVADLRSLKVFFVALARSLNIEAWEDQVTGNVFYSAKGKDVLVDFADSSKKEYKTGKLALKYDATERLSDPEYYRHFSLSRFNGETFSLLNYDDFEKWSKIFKTPSDVEAGYYMLTTGTRLADGSVMCNVEMFDVPQGSRTEAPLVMRQNRDAVTVIGSFNSESRFIEAATGNETSVLLTTGRGYFVVGVIAVGQEPTNHALKDIAARAKELEAWGRKIVLLFQSEDAYKKYMAAPVAKMPANVVMGVDKEGKIEAELRAEMHIAEGAPLPIFVIADTFNRVVYESHGYTIGLGDTLLKTINQIR